MRVALGLNWCNSQQNLSPVHINDCNWEKPPERIEGCNETMFLHPSPYLCHLVSFLY